MCQKYRVNINVGDVVADSQEEAEQKARELLYNLAESNDGSEVLANAKPELAVA